MELTTYIIKPEAFDRREEIRAIINSHPGLNIKANLTAALTKSDLIYLASIDKGYVNNLQLFSAFSHFMRQGLVELGLIEGPNSISTFQKLCGSLPNPDDCSKTTLRYQFGVHEIKEYDGMPFYLNGVHKPVDVDEVLFEKALFEDFSNRSKIESVREVVFRSYEAPPVNINPAYKNRSLMIWEKHILQVVKYGLQLCKLYGGNEEIVTVASFCHDWTRLKNDDNTHHITSAEETKHLLELLGYDHHINSAICNCILTHRGEASLRPENLEQKIVCSADGIANISDLSLLWFSAKFKHRLEDRDASDKVMRKLVKSYEKIMPEAKDLIRETYENNMNYLKAVRKR